MVQNAGKYFVNGNQSTRFRGASLRTAHDRVNPSLSQLPHQHPSHRRS